MQEVLQSTTIDESRILTEAAIYADKVAVDEETVRLRSHVSQLRDMLLSDEPMGRKMDFLIQEVNRESNTIGSKCNDRRHRARCGRAQGGGRKDPRAGAGTSSKGRSK
ncbi:MAG: endoribonuclease YicC domain-containing protein [Oscillibacter sp.]